MSSRVEVPSTQQDPAALHHSAAHQVTVAVIGPNNAHRKIIAGALSASAERTVHEFPSYPAKLSDVPSLIEQNFDVVMIDVDSDQSYALALVEKIAASGTTVMVYSRRDDAQLLLNCMRAGAREFLPLPDQQEQPEPFADEIESPAPAPDVESHTAVIEPPIEAEPGFNHFESATAPQPEGIEVSGPEVSEQPETSGSASPESSTPDFDEWDRMHLRALQSLDSKTRREITPQKAPATQKTAATRAASERKGEGIKLHLVQPPPAPKKIEQPKIEPPAQPEPVPAPPVQKKPEEPVVAPMQPAEPPPPMQSIRTENDWDQVWARAGQPAAETPQQTAAPAEEKPASQTWLEALDNDPGTIAPPRPKFDPSLIEPIFHYEEPKPEKHPHAMQFMVLAMGLGVLACLAVLYFFHPFGMNAAPPAAAAKADVPQSAVPEATSSSAEPQADDTSSTAPPAPAQTPSNPVAAPAAANHVSADQMDAQLNAPAQITPAIKRTARADEPPPPGGFTPGALESENALPGDVFAGSSKAKIVAPPPSAISAGIAQGMLLRKTEPIYPPFAKQTHVTGTVSIGATITKSGSLTNLHVISGPVMLRDSALLAVKTWRYRPYKLDDQPVEVQTTINLVFSLDK